MFPNAVTETITGHDENGEPIIERAIDADVLAQEINTHVVSGKGRALPVQLARARRNQCY